MPCGHSTSGGAINVVRNTAPVRNGATASGHHQQTTSPTTPTSIPNNIGGSGGSNTIATISNDIAGSPPQLGQTGFPLRPPLPPPPRSTHCIHGRPFSASSNASGANAANESLENGDSSSPDPLRPWWQSWNRKYVLLCGMCGLSSVLLGVFYLVIYFVLRSYTSSLEFFQTMPTYVPAAVLMLTGLLVLCFMRRKNRISLLIKVVGFLCLLCAVVCVVVTVTTTVLHMNRLQTLSECTFYTRLHSCTCHPFTEEDPFELKLDVSITTCDVIHGPLYSCLRAMFGVSVIGILVSIFSCMLVYQLLSHEKKKMYWEQLENRRRFLYRRTPGPPNNNCSCCDEYGFVPPAELYPWTMWDTIDERYWNGGTQLYSPTGEESSNASRSVLLEGNNPNGAPSLWLPWGGAWGANPVQTQSQGQIRDANASIDSVNSPGDQDHHPSEHSRPQTTGVVLRPYLPQGLEARLGLRRQPPPVPGHGGRRPVSDPGVALQLPRYPPAFSEAFLPPLPYEGLEAFSRFVWDPPPPYSQPVSQESLHASQSPVPSPPDAQCALRTPSRRPHTLANLIRRPPNGVEISSPTSISESLVGSPARFATLKETPQCLGGTGSLPLDTRLRHISLGHVKSLDDISETARESFEAMFHGRKELSSLDEFQSHKDVSQKLLALKAHHLKGNSDPRGMYGKSEQESELYFADVSSCVSVRPEDDKDDILYYSEPTSPNNCITKDGKTSPSTHMYEQVRHHGDREELEEGDEDATSHHTSDDTMIVHTSSSDHSLGLEVENAYSVASPSSASPMATDTDAYSCYQIPSPRKDNSFPDQESTPNLNNLHGQRYPPFHRPERHHHQAPQCSFNDNEYRPGGSNSKDQEPRYEAITATPDVTPMVPSDLNGNVALMTESHDILLGMQVHRANLTLPLRRAISLAKEEGVTSPDSEERQIPLQGRRDKGVKDLQGGFSPTAEQNIPSPQDQQRLQSVQEHLFALKSVNV